MQKKVTANIWPVDASTPNQFCFPEVPHIPSSKSTLGVCLSGGGNRSFSAAIGQLAALDKLGISQKINYLSTVSGGSWAGALYCFADLPSQSLLGNYGTALSQLTYESLTAADASFMGCCATKNIFHVFHDQLASSSPDTAWINTVKAIYLAPFALDDPKALTLNEQTLQAFKEKNPEGTHWDFRLPRPEKPFFIANSTLIWPSQPFKKTHFLPVELTPYHAGIYASHLLPSREIFGKHRSFGNGYLETVAFDTQAPLKQAHNKKQVTVSTLKKKPFMLSDVIGTSSAFFARMFEKAPLFNDINPRFYYWPVTNGSDGILPSTNQGECMIGDGGNFENLGIIPLLLRQVDKMIVFVNSETKFDKPRLNLTGEWKGIDEYLPPLFGHHSPFSPVIAGHPTTQVFQPGDFDKGSRSLLSQLTDCNEAGKPLVCSMRLQVMDNAWLGVRSQRDSGEPYFVEILWCYLGMPSCWYNQLSDDLKRRLQKGEFSTFPNYPTYGTDFHLDKIETWGDLGDFSLPQVKLLSQLTHDTLASSFDTVIQDFLRD